ncbi:hypothetical protein MKT61_008620 [Providencia rettgeri]|nr:hypothetical protein [Providencia rettgeri]
MNKNISITFEELNKVDMISIVSSFPSNFINHRSQGIPDEFKKQILHEQYKNGLETGHLELTNNGYESSTKHTDEAVEQEITGYKYVNNALVPIDS